MCYRPSEPHSGTIAVMEGETNLVKLLAKLSPVLLDGDYIFSTCTDAEYGDYAEAEPLASFMEREGLTLVLERESADSAGLVYTGIFKHITLQVHSSLDAVGLTAAVSARLSEFNISANIIAGYYHDHLFVPAGKADLALRVLKDISLEE